MFDNIFKKIYRKIKKYDDIVIARHVGPDPDAIASTVSLRDSIKKTFPNKNVYAVGMGVSRFKYYGNLDKVNEDELHDPLLIVLDVPNISRIDGATYSKYKEVIKIDHHPIEDVMGELDIVDETASSTCQIISELILKTNLVLDSDIASHLYLGIVSDSDRFLLPYTTKKTFAICYELINATNLDFPPLYNLLYERPLTEIRFQGYLAMNMEVSENGLGHILIDPSVIKEFNVDSGTASNMINNFNYIKGIKAWVFISYDERNDSYKANIRSRGPVINIVANKYNGGGHKFASGIKNMTEEQIPLLIADLDNACKQYEEN